MATNFIYGRNCIAELAQALGLDGRGIVRIRIDAKVRDATFVEITEIMQVEHHEKACEVIKRYRLEPVEPESSVKFREFT